MPSGRDKGEKIASICEDGGPSASLLREAEFAVASAISVREQQKSRLLGMISALLPPSQGAAPTARQQKATRRQTQEIPSPDLHLVGDVLLLLRAASVNVVERIQAWRQLLHQGSPRPYLHENRNYLLTITHDTDCLDKVDVLVDWLGFPLRRNPFITRDTLDQVKGRLPSCLETQQGIQDGQLTLSRLPPLRAHCVKKTAAQTTSAQRIKRAAPPASLVLPLASIMPFSSEVEGVRIIAAQRILLQEESLHGEMHLLQTARTCIQGCERSLKLATSLPGDQDFDIESGKMSLYDQLAIAGNRIRYVEKVTTRVRSTLKDAMQVLTRLDEHAQWIDECLEKHCATDLHIRRCQDKYRHDALKVCADLGTSLREYLVQLQRSLEQLQIAAHAHKQLVQNLEQEKERTLRARKLAQLQQRRQEPSKVLPVKRVERSKRPNQAFPSVRSVRRSGKADHSVRLPSTLLPISQTEAVLDAALQGHSTQISLELEEKRARSLKERAVLYHDKARKYERAQAELDLRRTESALMKTEEEASRALQRLLEKREQLKQRRALFDRISATAIFKCSHEMIGKRFLISFYEQKPRGYVLEGIRVTAYDPITSFTYSLALSLRQFDSYGYGRSREGLAAFSKWLCLLYEKRRRRFRLAWAGAPCPPPLRIRDYDCTLICAHKEGVKLAGQSGFALVAVYVRSDSPGSLRFVCGSLRSGNECLIEQQVHVRDLFASDAFVLVDEDTFETRTFVVWKHLRGLPSCNAIDSCDSHARENFFGDASAHSDERRHVHSGAMIVEGARVHAHVYDANSAEYIIDIVPAAASEPSSSMLAESPMIYHHRQVVLRKWEVNPHRVELPSESFRDLLACISVERSGNETVVSDGSGSNVESIEVWRAVVPTTWTKKLAKYVRVLRLAKFGSKIAGVYCLITVHLVQLKTEYRAQLLLELTPVTIANAGKGSIAKQSLYISLSDYLRCQTVTYRLGFVVTSPGGDNECEVCARSYLADPRMTYDHQPFVYEGQQNAHEDGGGFTNAGVELVSCPGCLATQSAQIGVLRDAFVSLMTGDRTAWSQEFLDLMAHVVHQGYCDACGTVLPPYLVVVGPELSTYRTDLIDSLGRYYWRCFDYSELVSSVTAHSHYSAAIQCDNRLADEFAHSVSRSRVTVLFNADFGFTVAGANTFCYELHALVFPGVSELPFQILYLMKDGTTSALLGRSHESRDRVLATAVGAMYSAASQIGESIAVYMGDSADASDNGLGFDAYLVSEALLIEAVRVLLDPHAPWKHPGGTVGSSSWPIACELLRDPHQLSIDLQLRDILSYSAGTRGLLTTYFRHTNWPHSYADVRPIFHMALAFMMHVEYVYRLLEESGGLLVRSVNNHEPSESSAEHNNHKIEYLHPQTSVLLLE